jgi:hypothetical protein
MSSAAKAECCALFKNATKGVALCNTLHEMGRPQPPTPIQVDNTTTNGFANKQIKHQRTKSIYMRFYWIEDHVAQKQFQVYWHLDQPTELIISQNVTPCHITPKNAPLISTA